MELDIGLFFAKSGIGYRVASIMTLYPIPDFAKKSPICNSILYSNVFCRVRKLFHGCVIHFENIPPNNMEKAKNVN